MRHVAIHLSNLLQLFVEDSLSLLLADVTHVFCLFVEDIREDQVPERCCQDPFGSRGILTQLALPLFRTAVCNIVDEDCHDQVEDANRHEEIQKNVGKHEDTVSFFSSEALLQWSAIQSCTTIREASEVREHGIWDILKLLIFREEGLGHHPQQVHAEEQQHNRPEQHAQSCENPLDHQLELCEDLEFQQSDDAAKAGQLQHFQA
mmetsp:Transcript_44906/g.104943  ORF Transcript_44906/g.104943 Transcript_44906/m.104943 type:complete len:205 (+) Transcript_44906:418-1032(+)